MIYVYKYNKDIKVIQAGKENQDINYFACVEGPSGPESLYFLTLLIFLLLRVLLKRSKTIWIAKNISPKMIKKGITKYKIILCTVSTIPEILSGINIFTKTSNINKNKPLTAKILPKDLNGCLFIPLIKCTQSPFLIITNL